MRRILKITKPEIAYYILLGLFTIYALLDTFVIVKEYKTEATQINFEAQSINTDFSGNDNEKNDSSHENNEVIVSEEISSEDLVKNENFDFSYEDDDIKVHVSNYRIYDTEVFIADIYISSASFLKTAFAEDTYGKNVTQKTSEIAETNKAIIAINGDYYGAREKGYVIRNGVLYNDEPSEMDSLCIYANGTFEIFRQEEKTTEQLMEKGAWQVFSFGPGLIKEGNIVVREDQDVNVAGQNHPRTAIGTIDNSNHFIFLVSDGRFDDNIGLSLYNMARIMRYFGVVQAYNLDGGGSSTLWFNGEVLNHPTSYGDSIQERAVSDIVYIGQN